MEEKKTTKKPTTKKVETAEKKPATAKPAAKKTTGAAKKAETKTAATKTTKPAAKKVTEKVEPKPAAQKTEAKVVEKKTTSVKKPATKKVEAAKTSVKSAAKKPTPKAKVEEVKVEEPKKQEKAQPTKAPAAKPVKKTTAKKGEVEEKVSSKVDEKPVDNSVVVENSTKKTTAKKKAPKKAAKVASKKTPTKKVEKAEKTVEVYEAANFTIAGYNDLPLNVYLYDNTKNPKAVIILLHGMQEHSLRYKAFAEYLNKNDFIVVASDLRGHGLTAPSKNDLGFGENDIFAETINDQLNIISEVANSYNLPIYLFGHSYGSMLTQKLIQCSPIVEKAVLCGTASGDAGIIKLGNLLINIMSPFKNHNKRGGLVEKMCIKAYGKKFENGNWLTKDEEVFKAYQEDEYCGGSFPFSFYKSMLNNLTRVNNGIAKVGNKKIFFIAGDQDPVNNGGKDVEALHNFYLKNNIDSKIKIYKNDRHEILNETDKAEVWQDVVDFFNF